MTTTNDTTGPAVFGREQGQGARSERSGVADTSDLKIAPSGPETGNPDKARLDRLAAETEDATGKGCKTMLVATEDMARLFARSKRLDEFEADAVVSALTIRLADVEAERDELARKVEALSAPRVFNVAGLVEADLAERYTSLRAAHDAILVAVPTNWRETGAPSIEAHVVDLIGIAVSFMENLAGVVNADGPFKGWTPADDPAEFVIDAVNRITDAEDLHAKDLREWFRLWRPVNVFASIEKRRRGEELTPAEETEIALWSFDRDGKAVRFLAELATMTDTECDFLDGFEVRSSARLLQVPDELGETSPTVPRLYSVEDRIRAVAYLAQAIPAVGRDTDHKLGVLVDGVAEMLGMRRAGA